MPLRRAGARRSDDFQTYDEEAWGGKERPQYTDRADGEVGGGGGEPAATQIMNVGRLAAPEWPGVIFLI